MTLGGRFQWMAVKFIDDPFIDGAEVAPESGLNDIIYGGFFYIFILIYKYFQICILKNNMNRDLDIHKGNNGTEN